METLSQKYALSLPQKGLPYKIWAIILGGVVVASSLILLSPPVVFVLACAIVFSLLMCLDIKKGLLVLTVIRVLLDAFNDKIGIPLSNFRTLSLSSGVGIFIFVFGLNYILVKKISIWRMPMFAPFALFMTACLISLFNTTNLPNSIADITELASVFILFFLVVHTFTTPRDIERLVNFMIISSLIPVGLSLLKISSNHNLTLVGLEPSLRAQGTLSHPNVFAFYLVIISILVLIKWLNKKDSKQGFKWLLYFIILQIPLIYTFTRGAWLALLIALLLVGLFGYRKLLRYVPICLLIITLLVPMVQFRVLSMFDAQSSQYDSSAWRVMIWAKALPYFFANPIFGNGFGNFVIVGFKIDDWYAAAHNDYLRLLVEVGIVGFIGFLCIMLSLLKNGIQVYRKSIDPYFQLLALGFIGLTMGYLVNSAVDNLFNHGGIQWYFLSYAAIITVMLGPKQNDRADIVPSN